MSSPCCRRVCAVGDLAWVRDAHGVIAWVLILLNGAAGLWAVISHRFPRLQVRPMWWAVLAGYATAFVMAISGAALVAAGSSLGDFHALYGFSTVIAVAILVSYRRSPFVTGKVHLLYGFGSLFIMGLGLRNVFISPVG